jgi:hypothetical protein
VLGRLVGVGVTDIVGIRNSETWQWVDPGAFGLIGRFEKIQIFEMCENKIYFQTYIDMYVWYMKLRDLAVGRPRGFRTHWYVCKAKRHMYLHTCVDLLCI